MFRLSRSNFHKFKPKDRTPPLQTKLRSEKDKNQTELEAPPIQIRASKIDKLGNQIYGMERRHFSATGNTQTGAIGIPDLIGLRGLRKTKPVREIKPAQKINKTMLVPIEDMIDEGDSPGITRMHSFAAGHGFSLFGGTGKGGDVLLFGCGVNTSKQLGTQKLTNSEMKLFKKIYKEGNDNEGTIHYDLPDLSDSNMLDYLYSLTEVPHDFLKKEKIIKISAGRQHAVVLGEKNAFAYGNNKFGQRGDLSKGARSDSKNVTLGYFRPVLKDDSKKRDTSKKIDKNYDNSEKIVYRHPVDIECGLDHTLFLADTKMNPFSTKTDKMSLNNITKIKNRETRSIYSCGWNPDGQVGHGDFEPVLEPKIIESLRDKVLSMKTVGDFNLALCLNDKNRTELWGWGNNEYQQLAEACSETQAPSPVDLEISKYYPDMVSQILKSDNRISRDIRIEATDISCSGTCAFVVVTETTKHQAETSDNFEELENPEKSGKINLNYSTRNYLFSWGSGPCLGLGPEVTSTSTPKLIDNVFLGKIDEEKFGHSWIVEVSGGLEHVIVRMSDGGCYGWGRNDDGRLGNNTFRNLNYPFPIVLKERAVGVSCGIDHTIFATKYIR